jgi:hypothetical protein
MNDEQALKAAVGTTIIGWTWNRRAPDDYQDENPVNIHLDNGKTLTIGTFSAQSLGHLTVHDRDTAPVGVLEQRCR